jgi:N-acetylneuraminic acid mutarotase
MNNRSLILTVLSFLMGGWVMAQSWTAVDSIPTGVHHPVTFSLDGKGYAITGTTPTSSYTKDVYQYDPVTDSWTSLADFPGPARSYSIGVVNGGKAYMGFGAKGTDDYLDDLWSYDPSDSTWTELENCPCVGRAHPAMISLGDKIYVGLGNNTVNRKDWWVYSIPSDSWTQLPDLPGFRRHHPYQFAANGSIYAGLGHGSAIFKDWYKLDTLTNTWTTMANFPGEARVAGTQFDYNGFGYVLSGDGDNHSWMATGEMWRYDPLTDTWTQLTPHSGISRWAPGSFIIDDEVYFFGGVNRQNATYPANVEKFDLSSIGLSAPVAEISDLKVYPNPASNVLIVELGADEKISFLEIYAIDGSLQKRIENEGSSARVDLSAWSTGTYILKLATKSGGFESRLFIKN